MRSSSRGAGFCRRSLIFIVAVALCSACSTESAGSTSTDPAQVPNSSGAMPPTSEEVTAAEPSPESTSADELPTTPAPAPLEIGEPILSGFEGISLFTPEAGGGTRPLLVWGEVDGAEYYSLVLYAPDGQPYWGSLLKETETFVGGPIQIEEGKPGPSVSNGMSWSVVALDADLLPLASSQQQPLRP